MTILESVILGMIQGITEFFPVSSSGHLVIFQSLLGLREPQLAFDIFLHLGTLVSILIFFAKDIGELFRKERRVLGLLVVASIPTAFIGFFFKDAVERLFGMPKTVGYMLIITGALLIATKIYSAFAKDIAEKKENSFLSSVMIGIAQGIAVIPGISRSGSTIATGILSGLKRETAFRFSLLLSVPAIAGASLLKMRKITMHLTASDSGIFLAGGIVAMITGIFAIKTLLKVVRNNQLYIFGIYCVLVGSLVAVFLR